MIEDLKTRLNELKAEIETASDDERDSLMEHVEQAALALEAQGASVPGWAKALIASRVDENVEDMFDNMPV
ncbi:hypothetical protein [Pelagimonas varians]|uniref:Uncharacterized protein n=1 Tax=Pelagimonas varians TaxID=696760 RepID=A0A238L6J0_9RHOB|nr:hypothetical protein [Pelagimonas varians]PYG25571.1 hypothetical protein C8N36_12916 [Pelagimonas varians]SMX50441.1 hypothetical protein PEV8663_04646 [Pelagimonas varians]